jgi:F0F1-type ATP synthase assembly protein I
MDSSAARAIGKYVSLALLLPISTFVGYAMGYGLDMLLHTGWLRYVFLLPGAMGGFLALIRESDRGSDKDR